MSAFDPISLLGQAEGYQLEFKEAESLRRPANIAREVVGFLNANGGHIWIGVKEEKGRAVAVQSIPDLDQSLISLRDHLIDTIEPQFQTDEVKLDGESGLIHVRVFKGHRPPYAQRDSGRRFLIRIDARLQEMSREEIGAAFVESSRAESTKRNRVDEIAADIRKQASLALKSPQLWLGLVPTESLEIDFEDKPTWKQVETWLMDPSATGNRRSGWNFTDDFSSPRLIGDHVKHGYANESMGTSITKEGGITFTLGSDHLRRLVGAGLHFNPLALVEYPTSVFRLMAAILKRFGDGHTNLQVVAGLVISGIRGWSLQPGSPREPARQLGTPKVLENDVLEVTPLAFHADKLKENPDRCSLTVVRHVYGEFGFGYEAIPPEFDQKQGHLFFE
jgi:hypothetical protein